MIISNFCSKYNEYKILKYDPKVILFQNKLQRYILFIYESTPKSTIIVKIEINNEAFGNKEASQEWTHLCFLILMTKMTMACKDHDHIIFVAIFN